MTVLTRGAPRSAEGWRSVSWDGRTVGAWTESLDGADAIVHLSGKRVDCRPTRRNLQALISSRVGPVEAMGQAVATLDRPPPVWVQLSSLAIYGEGGEEIIDEDTVPSGVGPPQMVRVCQEWEAAFGEAAARTARTVLLRPGIGIGGAGDPATARLLMLARFGLGGRVGDGRQWVSWVSLDDFMAVLLLAIDEERMSGVYHLTSPNPIRNHEMMAVYRRLGGRDFGLPSPKWVTEIGARLLGSDPALALTGRRAVPKRLTDEGYRFIFPNFADAADRAVVGSKGISS